MKEKLRMYDIVLLRRLLKTGQTGKGKIMNKFSIKSPIIVYSSLVTLTEVQCDACPAGISADLAHKS